MDSLSPDDYQAVLQCVGEINAETEFQSLPTLILRSIGKLVPNQSAAFTEVDPVLGQSSGWMMPDEPYSVDWIAPRFQKHIADHPVVQHAQRTRDGQAKSISDFMTARQFHSTGLYRELFSVMKIEDQLSIGMVGSAGSMIGLSFNRSRRGFSPRDRDILNLLRPHILQAFITCRQLQILRNADGIRRGTIVDRLPIGLICIDSKGKIIWSTEPVQRILTAYYSDAGDSIHGLPHAVRIWLRSNQKQAAKIPTEPLVSRRIGFQLQVRCCPLRGGQNVLLLQEISTTEARPPLDQYGFTRREKQVMSTIIAGATVSKAAKQLGISPRTLGKHFERVFQKLSVNSLSAACIKLLGPIGRI